MANLTDHIAFVTGAGRRSGIGAAVAKRLAQDGANVVLGDLCAELAADLPHPGIGQWEELRAIALEVEQHGVRCLPVQVDVTDFVSAQKAMEQVVEVFGRLDILVNNAGAIFGPAPIAEMAETAWRKTLEVNATGTFLVSKAALPVLIQGGRGGRIVNIASLAAWRPGPYMAAYAASKAAVAALTQSLAQEIAPHGITANAVLPGDIDTGMKQWGYRLESRITRRPYEDILAAGIGRIPVGRLGTPEDVASLVAFLVSAEAAFITGQCYAVSGGRELT